MQDFDIQPGLAAAAPIPKLARQRLHDSVVAHLRQLIVESILAPGTKLNERELCETMGISRTPLREALKVLEVEGLIEISPNRGASVYKMSHQEVWETFEFVSGLEAMAGEMACARITDEEVAVIKQLHEAMLVCKATGDLPGYYRNNQSIHNRIAEATRNSVLLKTYLSMNRRLQSLRLKSNISPGKWDQAVGEHQQMIEALDARDGQRLGMLLAGHLLEKRAAVMDQLTAGERAA